MTDVIITLRAERWDAGVREGVAMALEPYGYARILSAQPAEVQLDLFADAKGAKKEAPAWGGSLRQKY